jgi:hypothetical protein
MTTVRRGFRYDRGNSKLEVVVDGKVVARFNDISPSLTLDSALPVASGGTGVATLTNHGVVIGQAAAALAITGAGTAGQVLTSNGASADPTFTAPVVGSLSIIIALS